MDIHLAGEPLVIFHVAILVGGIANVELFRPWQIDRPVGVPGWAYAVPTRFVGLPVSHWENNDTNYTPWETEV
ncbi:MAG: hypothetical protein ACLQMO_09000 [Acidobacteriaceae bacterium]